MRRSTFLLPALVLVTAPALATAQTVTPMWEIGVSVGLGPQFTGTYAHRFPTALPGHPEAVGTGGQDVRLRGRTGDNLAISLTRTLGRNMGVQLVFAAARAPLGGPSSDYAWTLHYTSRQPPDYQPQPLDVAGSTAWPRTDGTLRQLALAANLVVRYPVYERLTLSFSGGVAVQRLEGEIAPLGVTLFSEGGHSTLSSETYRVRVALGRAYAAGVDLGTEFSWSLGERLSVALEVRYFAAPSMHLSATVDEVLNNAEVIHQMSPAALNAAARVQRVELDPSFGTALVGLRYRL